MWGIIKAFFDLHTICLDCTTFRSGDVWKLHKFGSFGPKWPPQFLFKQLLIPYPSGSSLPSFVNIPSLLLMKMKMWKKLTLDELLKCDNVGIKLALLTWCLLSYCLFCFFWAVLIFSFAWSRMLSLIAWTQVNTLSIWSCVGGELSQSAGDSFLTSMGRHGSLQVKIKKCRWMSTICSWGDS